MWLKPSTVAPGAHAVGLVLVKNFGTVVGTVMTPGCPVTVGQPAAICPQASHTRLVTAGRHAQWWWGWYATSDGTRTGTPLPAGAYTVAIGGATVTITVS